MEKNGYQPKVEKELKPMKEEKAKKRKGISIEVPCGQYLKTQILDAVTHDSVKDFESYLWHKILERMRYSEINAVFIRDISEDGENRIFISSEREDRYDAEVGDAIEIITIWKNEE